MRQIVCLLSIALAVCGGTGVRAEDESAQKVGVTMRRFVPAEPYDWRGAQTHALVTTIWYPAAADAPVKPHWIGPPDTPMAAVGTVADDAAMATAPARFPLIVLSHGTGGNAAGMAWLGTALAAHGYVVAAVNHPGNTRMEAYTVQGFSQWWLRARDLGAVIDAMLADANFGSRIDPARIAAAGFSLGGYTMIALAGGITDLGLMRDTCLSASASCQSPAEFPDLRAKRTELLAQDPQFRDALGQAGASYRDLRVRVVFAIAPGLGFAFTAESLRAIKIPVRLVVGDNDRVVMAAPAQRFADEIPGAELTILPGGVGHYAFFNTCTAAGRSAEPAICVDAPGIDRSAIHDRTIDMALKFFAANLQ
jgi:predicted dienelactone hydrolase